MASPTRSSSLLAWSTALICTLAFSVAAPIGTALINLGINPTTILMLRFWIAAGLLFGTLRLTAPSKLRLPRRGLVAVLVAGPAIAIGILLYFWALTRVHTSIAAMFFALEPVVALLLLALRGERFTYRNLVRVALGVGGVYLLVSLQGSADWVGLLMLSGTVLFSAFHTVALQWYFGEYDGRTVTFYMVLAMAITTSACWLAQLAVQPAAVWRPLPWQAWVGIPLLALVSTYIARLTLFAAVRRLGGGQVALLAPVETFLTIIWSVLFLGDRLSLAQAGGGLLILLSAALAVRRLRRAKVPQPDETAEVVAM